MSEAPQEFDDPAVNLLGAIRVKAGDDWDTIGAILDVDLTAELVR